MKMLRALLIATLVISIPLPAIAAAFGASSCMTMQSDMGASTMHAEMQHHSVDVATSTHDKAQQDCCCDDCVNCDTACATSTTATFNNLFPNTAAEPPAAFRVTKASAQLLPAHSRRLIRPPGVL